MEATRRMQLALLLLAYASYILCENSSKGYSISGDKEALIIWSIVCLKDLGRISELTLPGDLKVVKRLSIAQLKLPDGAFPDEVFQFEMLEELAINHAGLVEFPLDISEKLKRLVCLNLSQNKISSIKNYDKAGAWASLTQLSLRDNYIYGVPQGLLAIFPVLAVLDLRENEITHVPNLAPSTEEGAASEGPMLKSLLLQDNAIVEVSEDLLLELPGLEVLNLSKNYLEDLKLNIGDGNASLKSLNLSANKFRVLPTGLLAGLRSLADLDLSANTELLAVSSDIIECVNLLGLWLSGCDSMRFSSPGDRVLGCRDLVKALPGTVRFAFPEKLTSVLRDRAIGTKTATKHLCKYLALFYEKSLESASEGVAGKGKSPTKYHEIIARGLGNKRLKGMLSELKPQDIKLVTIFSGISVYLNKPLDSRLSEKDVSLIPFREELAAAWEFVEERTREPEAARVR